MYCSKCGNQLEDGAKVCNNCGCPTEYYNQTIAITKTDSAIKLEILLVCAAALTLIIFMMTKLLYGENSIYSLPSFVYQIPNLFYIAQSILIIIFCIMNIKIESKIWKTATVMVILGAALLLMNDIQWMLDYSNDASPDKTYLNLQIQFVIFRVLLFVGLALILIAVNKIATLTATQKTISIIGVVLSFIYIPWLLFIELPHYAIEYYLTKLDGLIDSYAWTFYGLYQPFIGLLENNIVKILGSICYIVIAIMFFNTKKIENN